MRIVLSPAQSEQFRQAKEDREKLYEGRAPIPRWSERAAFSDRLYQFPGTHRKPEKVRAERTEAYI
jgi:hypothetical protein